MNMRAVWRRKMQHSRAAHGLLRLRTTLSTLRERGRRLACLDFLDGPKRTVISSDSLGKMRNVNLKRGRKHGTKKLIRVSFFASFARFQCDCWSSAHSLSTSSELCERRRASIRMCSAGASIPPRRCFSSSTRTLSLDVPRGRILRRRDSRWVRNWDPPCTNVRLRFYSLMLINAPRGVPPYTSTVPRQGVPWEIY